MYSFPKYELCGDIMEQFYGILKSEDLMSCGLLTLETFLS